MYIGVENVVSRDHTAFLGEEVEVSRYYPLLEGWLNVPYIPPIEIVSSLEDLKGVVSHMYCTHVYVLIISVLLNLATVYISNLTFTAKIRVC